MICRTLGKESGNWSLGKSIALETVPLWFSTQNFPSWAMYNHSAPWPAVGALLLHYSKETPLYEVDIPKA